MTTTTSTTPSAPTTTQALPFGVNISTAQLAHMGGANFTCEASTLRLPPGHRPAHALVVWNPAPNGRRTYRLAAITVAQDGCIGGWSYTSPLGLSGVLTIFNT